MTVSNDDPNTFLPGTWEKIKDRFLLGSGDIYNNASTGGEATHKLTSAESGLPSHSHQVQAVYGSTRNNVSAAWQNTTNNANVSGAGWGGTAGTWNVVAAGNSASNASAAHNNMPPYLVVNI